jgi:tetratricopeptide (TPR) repeat protein
MIAPQLRHLWHSSTRTLMAILMLAAGGLLLLPLSRATYRAQQEQALRLPPPHISQRDALSQQLAFFTLGGLRSLAAEITALDATNAWMKRDWQRADARWSTVTTLAPRRTNYWASASRDMATNAAGDFLSNDALTETERLRQARYYIDRGEAYLLQGIANNPTSITLHARLGDLYSDLYRQPRFAKAEAAYARAVELGAPAIYNRLRFYNLCRIRGREAQALQLGRQLFADSRNHVPALRTLLFVLQNKLNLPEHERLSVEQIFGTRKRALRDLRTFRHNRLLYPTTGIDAYLEQNP